MHLGWPFGYWKVGDIGRQWFVVSRQFFKRCGYEFQDTSTIKLRPRSGKSGIFAHFLSGVVGGQWSVLKTLRFRIDLSLEASLPPTTKLSPGYKKNGGEAPKASQIPIAPYLDIDISITTN
jgi:hypothetical protein